MADKQLGAGALLEVDAAASGAWTQVALVIEISPPSRERAAIEETALADVLEVMGPGLEQAGEAEFVVYHDPKDPNHLILDTLFASQARVPWRITYPHSDTPIKTFTAWVKGLSEGKLTKSEYVKRTVKLQRTSAITQS